MIFHSWASHFVLGVLEDEQIPSASRLTDTHTRTRVIENLLAGRGADNPRQLTSWVDATEESIFFDRRDTDVVETSDEIILLALQEALDFLESPPDENKEGGFGTADMDAWLWGLRHTLRLESILTPFIAGIEGIGALFERFSITPAVVPLTEETLSADDPRRGLKGFPRGGNQFSVDLARPQYRRERYEYRDGPVKRMVIALYPDGRVAGQNIVPGGQSGLTDSPHFADQLRLWLGNQATPIRFHVDEIVDGAVGREAYVPE